MGLTCALLIWSEGNFLLPDILAPGKLSAGLSVFSLTSLLRITSAGEQRVGK